MWPLFMSQSHSVLAPSAATARQPSDVTATALMKYVEPSIVRMVWPFSRSQSRSVASSEPETARRPSGVTATALSFAFGHVRRLDGLADVEPIF